MLATIVLAFVLGLFSAWFATRKTLKLTREASELNRSMLERYRDFVAGLAEASRRGIFPPELAMHCENLERAAYTPASAETTRTPPDASKPRQRANTGQERAREARRQEYNRRLVQFAPPAALVEGLPDRDGDGVPDKPPQISEVLAEVYDQGEPPAPGVEGTAAEVIARRLLDIDSRRESFNSPTEYRRYFRRAADEFVRLVARELGRELDLDRLVMLAAEVERLRGEYEAARERSVRAWARVAVLESERDESLVAVVKANDAVNLPRPRRAEGF